MPPYSLSEFAGKAVLVTGASTGIGAAVAAAFAPQGASMAIHYHANGDAATAVRDAILADGGRAVLVRGDFSKPAQGAVVVNKAVAALGGLNILVNNAGSLTGRIPFLEWTDATFDAVMNLNVRSVITTSQTAVPHLGARGGTIVNLARSPATTEADPDRVTLPPPKPISTI